MNEDTEPQDDVFEEVMDAAIEQGSQEAPESQEQAPQEKMVPLSVVQKERRKRQEAEARAQRYEIEQQIRAEQAAKSVPVEEDETQYESATKAELKQSASQVEFNTVRQIEERIWKNANPEKASEVDERLATFLKQRPHLASAINSVPNRYEEAYLLMSALSPKQQAELKAAPQKKVAPGNPNTVPKAAAINQVEDIMNMTDDEYRSWRQSKRARR